jgi:wyosine [tRNA(Phe)-imidazoG37] synthetase (radical SAM superfamily)
MKTTVLSEHSRQFEQLRFAYPVVSRRSRGLSLGLNVNPDKVCNFDCPYCQVDRTVPPRDTRVDFDVMVSEIDALMAMAASGEIWTHPKFADTPPHLRRLNDVAFAGDGEPTTYPRLGEAIREVARLREKHGLPDVKIIVLTNALLLNKLSVLGALEELTVGPYEVWAKLDAGSQDYFEFISGREISLDRIVDNIALAGTRLDITIQALFPTFDGAEPPYGEFDAFAERIREIQAKGGNLRLVQIYTTARKPGNPRIGMIEDARLDQIGAQIAMNVDVPVEVYYGRHWDSSD